MKPFDYSSLQQPISPELIQQFRAANQSPVSDKMTEIMSLVVAGVGAIFAISGIGNIIQVVFGLVDGQQAIIGGIGVFVGLIMIISAPLFLRQKKMALLTSIKIARFAAANGQSYQARYDNPPYPGLLFSLGSRSYATDRVYTIAGEKYEFANYTYIVGSGKDRRLEQRAYICITLDRTLPNMVLDSLNNNPKLFGIHVSNLPVSFKKDQILNLEGDFNKHFTLYAPKEYEQDALYVFTPDLMALMIDEVSKFDAEVVDNKLYIYSPTRFTLDDQAALERIFDIINLVGVKAISQTERYVDDRSVVTSGLANSVGGSDGRRLKRRVPVMAIAVVVGIFFLTQAISIVLAFMHK